jgi:hypothetical protein
VQQSGVGTTNATILRIRPGYHGSLWLDAASGTVLRITMEADTKDNPLFKRADMLVQYGPVEIGGSTFICPVRSLAFSLAASEGQDIAGDVPTEWLNETLFTGYHRFAATTRILSDTPAPQ